MVGEAGFSLTHSSSTGDLYSAAAPSTSKHVDTDTECHAGETVLLSQQMKRCADSVVALRSLFVPDDTQGDRIISLLYNFAVYCTKRQHNAITEKTSGL